MPIMIKILVIVYEGCYIYNRGELYEKYHN